MLFNWLWIRYLCVVWHPGGLLIFLDSVGCCCLLDFLHDLLTIFQLLAIVVLLTIAQRLGWLLSCYLLELFSSSLLGSQLLLAGLFESHPVVSLLLLHELILSRLVLPYLVCPDLVLPCLLTSLLLPS